MSILIDNIRVRLNGKDILKNVSLTVPAGKISTIIGANGAGKSTLLKTITGDVDIHSGNIKLHGKKINPKVTDAERARNVAFLPQLSLLNFPYTVEEVVKLGRTPHKTGEQLDLSIVQECLSVVEMNDFAHKLYPQLSGGEKQRVQLARVLAQIWRAEDSAMPRILLLDEPNSSLDLGHQKTLMHFLQEFTKDNITILMVLHNINTAANYSNHLIAMHDGQIVANDKPEKVITPELIQQLFSIDCLIMTNPKTGKPFIIEE